MKTTIRNGKNVWINSNGTKIKSATRPNGEWYPAYPESRIHGDRYEFYSGTSDWIRAANASMKQTANDNFLK